MTAGSASLMGPFWSWPWGGLFIFVPWAVMRLDTSRFPRLVDEARLKHEKGLAGKGR